MLQDMNSCGKHLRLSDRSGMKNIIYLQKKMLKSFFLVFISLILTTGLLSQNPVNTDTLTKKARRPAPIHWLKQQQFLQGNSSKHSSKSQHKKRLFVKIPDR